VSTCQRPFGQRGAALLLAMVVVALVSTVAAGMVWQQARAVDAEAAQRERAQLEALSAATVDFVRLLIRQLLRTGATPENIDTLLNRPSLKGVQLKNFVALDRDNTLDLVSNAYLDAKGEDASRRYNLRQLFDPRGEVQPTELKLLQRLCGELNLPSNFADELAAKLKAAWFSQGTGEVSSAPIPLYRVADLAWLELDPTALKTLAEYVDILPLGEVTKLNLNTADKVLIMAAIPGMTSGAVDAVVKARPIKNLGDVQLPEGVQLDTKLVGVDSRHFYAHITLFHEDLVLEETYLLRYGTAAPSDVKMLQRKRNLSKVTRP
jgi:general secretion pathway protein K